MITTSVLRVALIWAIVIWWCHELRDKYRKSHMSCSLVLSFTVLSNRTQIDHVDIIQLKFLVEFESFFCEFPSDLLARDMNTTVTRNNIVKFPRHPPKHSYSVRTCWHYIVSNISITKLKHTCIVHQLPATEYIIPTISVSEIDQRLQMTCYNWMLSNRLLF